ncbi:magnesium transporter CorA family protein [Conyzicola nivalis]|uniref:Magnesium transporter CorA n=1 Tax=Conyzicola nivalis TaxID=1477021 RepID=A0A916SLW4_9MICO|nr:magnesium transporter CorA family protein [Conyzicola nivalis]GGB02789.1 magnesium transporter CorA [Conyzicola nivalis]
MVTTRLYRAGKLVKTDFPVAEISDYLEEADATVWADFTSPTAADLAIIEEELSLHHLAVEDAIHEHQRPKLDRYDSHLFLTAYAVDLDAVTHELTKVEVKAFITSKAVVTVHPESFDMDAVVQRWDSNPDLAKYGSAFLLWGILDVIVDGHFETVQDLDGEIETYENLLFDDKNHGTEIQRNSFELRKNLVGLRRAVLPMREVVNTLMRRDMELMAHEMVPYFQDVYDHVLRATEWTESLRDLVATILDTNLSIQGNRMNLIMKKVTSWAAIIAVPTAITGFFGQNLQFVGFGTEWGSYLSLGLIVVVGGALYASFKRRDWL